MDSLAGAIIAQGRNPLARIRGASVLDNPERPTRGRRLGRASRTDIDSVMTALERLSKKTGRCVGALVQDALGYPVSRANLHRLTKSTLRKLLLYCRSNGLDITHSLIDGGGGAESLSSPPEEGSAPATTSPAIDPLRRAVSLYCEATGQSLRDVVNTVVDSRQGGWYAWQRGRWGEQRRKRLALWLSSHWPEGVIWPMDLERPKPDRRAGKPAPLAREDIKKLLAAIAMVAKAKGVSSNAVLSHALGYKASISHYRNGDQGMGGARGRAIAQYLGAHWPAGIERAAVLDRLTYTPKEGE